MCEQRLCWRRTSGWVCKHLQRRRHRAARRAPLGFALSLHVKGDARAPPWQGRLLRRMFRTRLQTVYRFPPQLTNVGASWRVRGADRGSREQTVNGPTGGRTGTCDREVTGLIAILETDNRGRGTGDGGVVWLFSKKRTRCSQIIWISVSHLVLTKATQRFFSESLLKQMFLMRDLVSCQSIWASWWLQTCCQATLIIPVRQRGEHSPNGCLKFSGVVCRLVWPCRPDTT